MPFSVYTQETTAFILKYQRKSKCSWETDDLKQLTKANKYSRTATEEREIIPGYRTGSVPGQPWTCHQLAARSPSVSGLCCATLPSQVRVVTKGFTSILQYCLQASARAARQGCQLCSMNQSNFEKPVLMTGLCYPRLEIGWHCVPLHSLGMLQREMIIPTLAQPVGIRV